MNGSGGAPTSVERICCTRKSLTLGIISASLSSCNLTNSLPAMHSGASSLVDPCLTPRQTQDLYTLFEVHLDVRKFRI